MDKRWIIFGVLGLVWVACVLRIMAPSLGLAIPVFPRPQPDYELYTMLATGILLVIYSVKTGIDYLRP